MIFWNFIIREKKIKNVVFGLLNLENLVIVVMAFNVLIKFKILRRELLNLVKKIKKGHLLCNSISLDLYYIMVESLI